jgi:hypothetical protein
VTVIMTMLIGCGANDNPATHADGRGGEYTSSDDGEVALQQIRALVSARELEAIARHLTVPDPVVRAFAAHRLSVITRNGETNSEIAPLAIDAILVDPHPLVRSNEIEKLLGMNVSKSFIAKMTGVDRATLYHFIKSRKLKPNAA